MDELTRREIFRGMILRGLELEKDRQLSDEALLYMVTGRRLEFTKDQVRHEMEYLRGKFLIEIKIQNRNLWIAKLTANGTDVLEGREFENGIILDG